MRQSEDKVYDDDVAPEDTTDLIQFEIRDFDPPTLESNHHSTMFDSTHHQISVLACKNSSDSEYFENPFQEWKISLKPKPASRFRLQKHDLQSAVFGVGRSTASSWMTKQTTLDESEPAVKIVVGELKSEAEVARAEAVLLSMKLPDVAATPTDVNLVWLREAIRRLQRKELVDEFDVEDFMTFAQDHVSKAPTGGRPTLAPSKINYVAKHAAKAHAKSNHQGFWFSHPQGAGAHAVRRTNDPYGGLM